jgi:pilus assembly protein CpaC
MGRLAIAAAAGLSLLISFGGHAAEPAHRASTDAALRAAAVVPPSGRPIVLQLHQGTLIRPPGPVSTVFVADSAIADVTIKTPSLIYVTAKKIGDTVIYAVDAHDRVLVNKRVVVQYDLPALRASLAQMLPGQLINVHAVGQDVMLTGTVTTAAAAHKAEMIAAQLLGLSEPPITAGLAGTPGATGTTAAAVAKGPAGHGRVIDQLAVATPNQVNLHVHIASVDATALKQLGIRLDKLSGRFQFLTINSNASPPLLPPPLISAASALNEFALTQPVGGGHSINALLDVLTQEGFATSLAEPNLTAVSGQKASFLVGGQIEIPGSSVPTSIVSAGTTPTTATSTQALSFGVRLDFTATILDANHISLRLRPEISTLNFANATTVAGTTIPGLDETIAETTVDLASGQSFALAGLLRHDTDENVSKVPGLGDIPVVGALFRTTSYTHTDTEVVITVTPYIVNPVSTRLATPVAGFQPPHDASRVLLGSMYRQTLPAPARGPAGPGGQSLIGPVGFRLD